MTQISEAGTAITEKNLSIIEDRLTKLTLLGERSNNEMNEYQALQVQLRNTISTAEQELLNLRFKFKNSIENSSAYQTCLKKLTSSRDEMVNLELKIEALYNKKIELEAIVPIGAGMFDIPDRIQSKLIRSESIRANELSETRKEIEIEKDNYLALQKAIFNLEAELNNELSLYKADIVKTGIFFEKKECFDNFLACLKLKIEKQKEKVEDSKIQYKNALSELEQISQSIHENGQYHPLEESFSLQGHSPTHILNMVPIEKTVLQELRCVLSRFENFDSFDRISPDINFDMSHPLNCSEPRVSPGFGRVISHEKEIPFDPLS